MNLKQIEIYLLRCHLQHASETQLGSHSNLTNTIKEYGRSKIANKVSCLLFSTLGKQNHELLIIRP